MKAIRPLPTGLALAGLLLVPLAAQERVTAREQPPVQERKSAEEPVWSIAVSRADGKVEVRDFAAHAPPELRDVVLSRGLAVVRGVEPASGQRDQIRSLIEAMKILDENGFEKEAARMREVIGEMTKRRATASLDGRAAALLRQDIQDRATRVGMLDVVAEGYAAAGWETNAATMEWFADVGRSQLDGGEPVTRNAPVDLGGSSGSLMEKLTEIILRCAPVQRELGNGHAAAMCERLGQYYSDRAAGLMAPPEEPEEEPEEEIAQEPVALRDLGYVGGGVTPRESDLTYIEGRVPVIGLAARAYALDGGELDGEERAIAKKWMVWMYESGLARIGGNVETPPLPGPVSMDALIEYIANAGQIYAANRRVGAAKRCFDLATYYRRRASGQAVDNSATGVPRPSARNESGRQAPPVAVDTAPEVSARRRELMQKIRALEVEMKDLQKQIELRRAAGGERR